MLTIRKFQPFLNDISQLVNEGTLSVEMAMLLHSAVVVEKRCRAIEVRAVGVQGVSGLGAQPADIE